MVNMSNETQIPVSLLRTYPNVRYRTGLLVLKLLFAVDNTSKLPHFASIVNCRCGLLELFHLHLCLVRYGLVPSCLAHSDLTRLSGVISSYYGEGQELT
jgi:hypothetical protein